MKHDIRSNESSVAYTEEMVQQGLMEKAAELLFTCSVCGVSTHIRDQFENIECSPAHFTWEDYPHAQLLNNAHAI